MENQELILEMFKEVSTELRTVNTKMDSNHEAAMKAITKNREEFVIFKTKINARTAMISTIIGFAIAVAGLLLQHKKLKETEAEKVKYEQTYIKTI
jgi:hypothetical protein